MDLNVNVKITLEETPALINCFSTFIESLHKVMGDPLIGTVPTAEIDWEPKPETIKALKVEQESLEAERKPLIIEYEAVKVEQAEAQGKRRYTIAEIQSACMPLMDEGKLDELAAVLKSFGAATLFEVAEEQYDALVVALIGLGAKL